MLRRSLALFVLALALLPAGASAQPSVEALEIASVPSQLTQVTSSGVAGDDRLFAVRKRGLVHIVEDGTVLGTPFLDIDAVVRDPGGIGDERGLLSIAFHPSYDTNGYVYVSYIDGSSDTVVARYTVSSDPNVVDTSTAQIVLTQDQPAGNHNGGQIVFGPDNYLYVAFGDGGSGCDAAGLGCNAQRTDSWLGAILRIDVDGDDFAGDDMRNYAVPSDNPFVGDGAVLDEIWSYGLRNPWRMSFDRMTGELWIGDVGQSGGDRREEIDRQPAGTGGQNWGWPYAEGNTCGPGTCSVSDCPGATPSCDALEGPIHEYTGGGTCAVTGGFVYRGSAIPGLVGWYVFGDYCTGQVWALDPSAPSTVPMILSLPLGLTSFGEDVDGELYIAINQTIHRIVATGGCVSADDCDGDFCVDGQCCDAACGGGDTTDCQACSVAAGAAADGVCGPISSGTVCRAADGFCDAEETCDGTALTCPDDVSRPDGSLCNADGTCMAGTCVPPTPVDASVPGVDSGTPPPSDAGSSGGFDGGFDGGPGGGMDDGCGCRAVGAPAEGGFGFVLALLGLMAVRRRRG